MNILLLAGIVGIAIILLGVLFAGLFVSLSRTVKTNREREVVRRDDVRYNPAETFGYEIPLAADVPVQLGKARRFAAAQAAVRPRGANMRIGPATIVPLRTASEELSDDPMTAVRIAAFHTWQGAKTGPPAGGTPAQPQAAPAAAAPTKKPEDLVPGVDYAFIEVTDDMPADEVRKARIANAKARSQAVKQLKQQPADVPTAGEPGEPVVAEMQKVSPAVVKGVPEPEYIDITDDMSPDEVRKARIANSKARSAYNKALKEAGVDPSQAVSRREDPGAAPAATAESRQAARPAEPTPASAHEAVAVPPPDIPEPNYVEITDDMSADEVRQARVQNSKMRSQFFKELKERGIDPKEWEAQRSEVADAAAEASEAAATPAAEPQAPAAGPAAAAVELPAHISPPAYTVVTDDMSADEVRQARVANARERSRFFKEIKDAGIDPKSLPPELTQP